MCCVCVYNALFHILTVSRPQSSEGDHPNATQQHVGFPISSTVASKADFVSKRKDIDGSISDSGVLIDLTQPELHPIHASSESALMTIHDKSISNGLPNGNVNSRINLFNNLKIESSGFGPRGSLV